MSAILRMPNPFESPLGSRSRPMALHTGSPKSSQPEQSHLTSPSTSMGPPSTNSPEVEQQGNLSNGMGSQNTSSSHVGAAAVGAAQGPKVVQTAFIHKLYSMLEDKTIQHLISWSNNGDSFVMSPSNEFSKVLAQYFKHTNISSFVRQLNMYGFHKVSDVFHTGSSESALWEFRHGNGNFKKGDLIGLREIKRRASRHTLIHRDSFTNTKPGPSQPGTPAEIIPDNETRITYLEAMLHDLHQRLCRTEDSYALMNTRCQGLAEGLGRCHSWIQNLSGALQSAVQPDAALHGELANMQKDIARQQDLIRSLEQPVEPPINGSSGRQPYYPTNMTLDPPVSPRAYGFSDSRRSSVQMHELPPFGSRPPVPPIPPQFATSPRRLGSVSITQTSPSFNRPPLPGPAPHPLSNVVSPPPPPNLARRHTSADIREHGWPVPNTNGSPYQSGDNSVNWQPSSPQQGPQQGDQQLQDQLARYEISSSRRPTITAADQESVPPAHSENPAPSGLGVNNVSWAAGASKFPRPNFELHSAPATRRSSMASNVHSLLNPADTAEQENEDEGLNDDRKRKRVG